MGKLAEFRQTVTAIDRKQIDGESDARHISWMRVLAEKLAPAGKLLDSAETEAELGPAYADVRARFHRLNNRVVLMADVSHKNIYPKADSRLKAELFKQLREVLPDDAAAP